MQVQQAAYLSSRAELANAGLQSLLSGPNGKDLKGALHIRLGCTAGLTWNDLQIEDLPLFLMGDGSLPFRLFEQISAHQESVIAVNRNARGEVETILPLAVKSMGFEENQALLPNSRRGFEGYRLLQEYFALPERYLFVKFGGLGSIAHPVMQESLDLYVLFNSVDQNLVNAVRIQNIGLFCTPIINLFSKRTDRVLIDPAQREFHIVVDRSRPMDFEVHSILEAETLGLEAESRQRLLPFFGSALSPSLQDAGHYTVHRRKRVLSSRQNRRGTRSSYIGSELFLSLVSPSGEPCPSGVEQIGLSVLATNRDLPFLMPIGAGQTDLTLVDGGPISAIRCVTGPTKPKPSPAEDQTAWRLISHLSLNYLSLVDQNTEHGAVALRELLTLYAGPQDQEIQKRISGLIHVESASIARRIPDAGPIVFGRGKSITLTFEESAYEGTGAFVLGTVLEQFLARYASINSFTETCLKTTERGEIMRWPIRTGTRHTL